MGDANNYDDATAAKIAAINKEEADHTDANLKGKMSHKAEGFDGLVPFGEELKPQMMNKWKAMGSSKAPSKVYMSSWADAPDSPDAPAPYAATLQIGFVAILDAKDQKVVKPLVKESFVLESAVSKTSGDIKDPESCKIVVTGGMQNMINIYDTSEKGPSGFATFSGAFSDMDDPKCDMCSHNGYIAGLEFTEKGLLSCSGDSTIKLWDPVQKMLVSTFKGHVKDCTGICTVPKCLGQTGDPNIFGSTSTDKTVRIWDMRVGGAVRKWTAKYSTNCCTMLPGGKGIAAGCDNASWEVFDTGCNMQVGRGKVKKGRCEAMASSPSGRVLYMGWDNPEAGFLMMADTYNPGSMTKFDPKKENGHTDLVKSLAMNPNGAGLLSSSFDGFTKLWCMP